MRACDCRPRYALVALFCLPLTLLRSLTSPLLHRRQFELQRQSIELHDQFLRHRHDWRPNRGDSDEQGMARSQSAAIQRHARRAYRLACRPCAGVPMPSCAHQLARGRATLFGGTSECAPRAIVGEPRFPTRKIRGRPHFHYRSVRQLYPAALRAPVAPTTFFHTPGPRRPSGARRIRTRGAACSVRTGSTPACHSSRHKY
jgi:hypothetical protein